MAGSGSDTSNIAMWGRGDYSSHTRGAKDVIDAAGDLVLEALGHLDVAGGDGPFAVADYGAADGGTSIDLIGRLVDAVRERHRARPITVTYTDLPSNDYSALFRLVHGLGTGPRTYRQRHRGVFTFAAATSFFEPIFPPASLDFGFSATAMHWLSGLPGPVSGHIHPSGAVGAERAALREQARSDWEAILLARAAELKAGGRLVLAIPATDERGRHMGNTGGEHLFDTMNARWRALAAAGVITEQEYRDTTIPQFYRTREELCAPVTDAASPVHRAGLRLERAQTRLVPCPYAARFAQTGDAETFAREYVPNTRTWSETVFLNALDPARPLAERRAIVERFFASFVEHVRARPEGHAMDYVHVYLVLAKVSLPRPWRGSSRRS